jgi:mono/diheme cytochrome c family protein
MYYKALLLLVFSISFLHCAEDDTPFKNGRNLYLAKCSSCHLDDGKGLGALIPPLAGADYLEKYRDRLPCIIRYGISDTIIVNGVQYTEQMAAVPELSDIDIANILNYIGNSWGNRQKPYQLDEVRQLLKGCDVAR